MNIERVIMLLHTAAVTVYIDSNLSVLFVFLLILCLLSINNKVTCQEKNYKLIFAAGSDFNC